MFLPKNIIPQTNSRRHVLIITKILVVSNPLSRIWRFYSDGFRSMTTGRSLWVLIIIKLVVLFGVIKLFFMPDTLGRQSTAAGLTPQATVARNLQLQHDTASDTHSSLSTAIRHYHE